MSVLNVNKDKVIEVLYELPEDKIEALENAIQDKIDRKFKEMNEFLKEYNDIAEYKPWDLFIDDSMIKEYFYEFNGTNETKRVKVTLNRNIISKNNEDVKKIDYKEKGKQKLQYELVSKIEQKKEINYEKEIEKYDFFLQYTDQILLSKNICKKAYDTIQILLDKFIYLNNSLYLINSKILNISKIEKTDIKNIVEEICYKKGLYYIQEKKDKVKYCYLIDYNKFTTYIKGNNHFGDIKLVDDLFLPKSEVRKNYKRKQIILVKNELLIDKPEKPQDMILTEEIKQKIINDYKRHWKGYLDDFIDYIVSVRFANDRKISYLNLNVKSDWGKGLLMGMFKELGIATDITIADLKEDKASGINLNDVLNSFVLFIDEFKKFNNILFKYTHFLKIEEKFKPRVEIPSYAKILLNADKSESFSYAVDEQIKNRVLIMDISNGEKITENPLYLENTLRYKYIIKNYFYEQIVKKVKYYVNLGRTTATVESEKVLRRLKEKYRIESDFNVDELIKDTIYNFIYNFNKKNEEDYSKFESNIKSNIIIKDGYVYIKSPVKTILNILKEELDDTQYKKVEYKKAQIHEIFNTNNKTYKVNGQVIRGFKLDLNDITVEMEEQTQVQNEKVLLFEEDDEIPF